MARKKTRQPRATGPAVRNWQAVAAHMRSSAGVHGGSQRQRSRRERAAARRELRRDY